MRLKSYLSNPTTVGDYFCMFEFFLPMNEMEDTSFQSIQKIGKRMGFKVKRSKSLIDYFKSISRGMSDLLRLTSLYMLTDIKDGGSRRELEGDMKEVFRRIDKKDLAAFLIQLDKVSFGLSSHIRHIFQSIFGVELATVNYWYGDIDYILKEIGNIRITMNKMGSMDNELKLLDTLESSIKLLKKK